MKYLIFFIICLQIFTTLGAASYEDDDYEYVYEDDYEYVDDCLDADDDGYCETDEEYPDEELDEEPEEEPEFGEDTTTVRVDMGNTARITCTVINLGSSVVSWKKDGSFLSLGGSLLADDPRISISMTPSSSELTITLVKGEDAGDYVCQVATTEIMAKTFTIEIKSPPNVKIVNKPESSTYTVKEGSALTILCEGEGDPKPTLSWKRLNSQMPASQNNQNSGSLQFSSISENESGTYQCIAGNGFGQPAVDSIQILVKHKPTIYVQEEYVENKENNKVELLQLICSVQAYPAAETTWTRSDNPLPEERMNIRDEDGRHILEISNPKQSDVGVYTCEAVNSEGKVYAVLNVKENENLPAEEAEVALKQLKEEEEETSSSANRGQFLVGSLTYVLVCLSLRAQL
eukprot:GFUD01011032.1.p1 GENE.GFUD01011032.1~~GFUD01011032.1.p1  ORF type:complete len:403 (+),score=108.26 GFUD01011032.1:192-1400(+)